MTGRNMSKVYVVMAHSGEYSDQEHWCVRVYKDKLIAQGLVDKLQKLIRAHQEWLDAEWGETRSKYRVEDLSGYKLTEVQERRKQSIYLESKARQDVKFKELVETANLDSMRKPSAEKYSNYLPEWFSFEEVEFYE